MFNTAAADREELFSEEARDTSLRWTSNKKSLFQVHRQNKKDEYRGYILFKFCSAAHSKPAHSVFGRDYCQFRLPAFTFSSYQAALQLRSLFCQ
jgi:hypothetical protein